MSSAPQRTGRTRLGFIDAARTLAMLLMLQGHVCDTLLASAEKASPFFQHYWFLRGLTAPLFFVLSGFALVVASDSRWDELGRPGPRLWARLRRAATLILIGYALQMPRWSNGAPFTFSTDEWRYVLRSGVLHCIAWSTIGAQVLIAVTGSKRAFARWSLGIAIGTLALTPWLARSSIPLPIPVAMLLRASEGSLFPLFPFIAHFFFGAALARLYLDARPIARSPRRLAAVLAGLGGTMAAASYLWAGLDPERMVVRRLLPAADPSLFLNRAGFAWLLFAATALLVGATRSPRWLKSVSSNALSVYVLHLVVLYGAPGMPGLIQRLGPTLSLPEAFAGGPLLLAFCAGVMAAWDVSWAFVRARAGLLGRRLVGARPAAAVPEPATPTVPPAD
jgi:acyltransferase